MDSAVLRPSPPWLDSGHPESKAIKGVIGWVGYFDFITFVDSDALGATCTVIDSFGFKTLLKRKLAWPAWSQGKGEIGMAYRTGGLCAAVGVI